jgi:hypothetical protein
MCEPTSYAVFASVYTKKVTTKHMVRLIHLLEADGLFDIPYKFYPEPITEGGLVLDWPGRKTGQYKSIRFGFSWGQWPSIQPTSRWDWEDEEPITIIPDATETCMVIKAFHGAPIWTKKELYTVRSCLLQLPCIQSVKGKMPSIRVLRVKDDVSNGAPSTFEHCASIFDQAKKTHERPTHSTKRVHTTTITSSSPKKLHHV